MGRPREFNEDRVIAATREAFWSRGVSATSVADISDATGLSVGSIYKAFSSKTELCHRTLDDYLTRGQKRLKSLFADAPTPVDALETWVEQVAAQAGDDSPTGGCYAVFCAAELAETDPAVRALLKAHDRAILGYLADALRDGEFACEPHSGARLLYTTVNGLMIEARKGIGVDEARATLSLALDGLR